MMAAALESDLAACELSLLDPTPRSFTSDLCPSVELPKSLTMDMEMPMPPIQIHSSPAASHRMDSVSKYINFLFECNIKNKSVPKLGQEKV